MTTSAKGKARKQQAGHYEIHGETIAKFELFDQGFNPYSRYLDVDKVDLILRRREGRTIRYVEIQVKYGRLYRCTVGWQKRHFDFTSFRFFKLNEFDKAQPNLYIAYVLVHPPPEGYKGDIFIFPVSVFRKLVKQAIRCNTAKGPQAKLYMAHSFKNNRWYLWKRKVERIDTDNTVNVTRYRRNFCFSHPIPAGHS